MITIENLHKTYRGDGRETPALRGVDLQVEAGEIFGIIGLSGAGKSTLVRCLNLLERPDRGRIVIDGRELSSLSRRALRAARQEIGMVFQQFNLLTSRTAAGNVALPLEILGWKRDAIRRRVAELLGLVGLADKADAYPGQLSGGQQQRVGIARALAARPKVLLCDEPTSALDPVTTRQILDLLAEINRRFGLTIVIITHELSVVKSVCHRVAVLAEGRVAEVGPVAQVIEETRSEAARRIVAAYRQQEGGAIA